MANFSALKTAIQNAIRQNGNEEITGDVLQQILLSVVNTMGDGAINTIEQNLSNETLARQGADNTLQQNIDAEALVRGNTDTQLQNAINAIKANIDNGYVYAGIATPSSTPVSGKVFYIATAAGTYTNFGGQVLTQGINILRYNGSAWSSQQLIGIDDVPTAGSNGLAKSGGVQNELALGTVYDVSAKNPTGGPNSDGKWESLSALLSDANLKTLIPTAYRKGGMSIKFVQSSDNNYIQARLMAQNFTTDVNQWQWVDEEPTAGSKNLVESGGVFNVVKDKVTNTELYKGYNAEGTDEVESEYTDGGNYTMEQPIGNDYWFNKANIVPFDGYITKVKALVLSTIFNNQIAIFNEDKKTIRTYPVTFNTEGVQTLILNEPIKVIKGEYVTLIKNRYNTTGQGVYSAIRVSSPDYEPVNDRIISSVSFTFVDAFDVIGMQEVERRLEVVDAEMGELPYSQLLDDSSLYVFNGLLKQSSDDLDVVSGYYTTDFLDVRLYPRVKGTTIKDIGGWCTFKMYDADKKPLTPTACLFNAIDVTFAEDYPDCVYFRLSADLDAASPLYHCTLYKVKPIGDYIKRVISVGNTGQEDFSSLSAALIYAINYKNCIVNVGDGEYDLQSELKAIYGNDFFDQEDFQYYGIPIGNGMVLNFTPKSKVVFNYTGTNQNVMLWFAPLWVKPDNNNFGFEINGLNLECSTCRYAIHDEMGGTNVFYKNVYDSCNLFIDNTNNTHPNSTRQCIGGGLGERGEIHITNCRFKSIGKTSSATFDGIVSYHNAASATAKSKIFVSNNYFEDNGTFRLTWYGSSNEITTAMVCGNRFGNEPLHFRESSSYDVHNTELVAWNNEIDAE